MVTVSDKSGAAIPGLGRDAFTILEDGKPQDIAFFTTEERLISVAILLDTSGSLVDKSTTSATRCASSRD
jgi:hypothetical protein